MSDLTLTQTRFQDGIWEGLLTGARVPPHLEALHGGVLLAAPELTAVPLQAGNFAVRITLPPSVLSEGVQTILIREAAQGAALAHVSVIAGVVMEDDLRAELDLLRAELDLLKSAFRRHCVESGT